MGKVAPLLELMQRDLDDPEAMTQFVHRCRASGTKASELIACLYEAAKNRDLSDSEARAALDRAMYGLLLALGEFQQDEIPETDRNFLTDQLVEWYAQHPSSAVHAATGWLLRQWGFEAEVLKVDRTPIPFDESFQRDWYVMEIKPISSEPSAGFSGLLGSLLGNSADKPSEPIYYTMIVFPPGEFVVGSPGDESSRQSNESQRRIRLTRPLAVSDREVTWASVWP